MKNVGIFIILLFVVCGISWIATVGIIKLICLCFDWFFSWRMATGIWLMMILISGIFTRIGGEK